MPAGIAAATASKISFYFLHEQCKIRVKTDTKKLEGIWAWEN